MDNPWDIKSDDNNHNNDDYVGNDGNDDELDELEFEEKLKRAEEENEKRLLIARVRKKLDDIMSIDPFIRNKKSILLKAFVVWSKVHPLNQKCNELAHQLQERLSVVESLRDSYLRDVVAVKYYLNKIHEYKQAQDEQIKANGLPDMYDLHAIPSTSLRHIIDKAKQGSEMTSDSLQEALIMSGLITPGSGKEIQVWDKSKMFKKQMKVKHGHSYKLPKTGGGTINLSAPGKHKVFVRYCNTCIGVMSFVHEWNQSIEEGLRRNVENLSYEANLQKLKNSIMSLNKIIEDQEKELLELKKKYYTLQNSGKWMEDWKNSLEIKESGVDFMKEELSKWKNCAGMADAEKETMVNETVLRFNEKIAKLQYQLIESNREIDRQVSLTEKERHSQVEVLKKVSASEGIIKAREQELKSTKATLEDKINEIKKLNLKVMNLQRDEANATKKMTEMQTAFDDYKSGADNINDDLRAQIMELEKTATSRDEKIEKLKDTIREIQKELKNKAKTIIDYQERDRKTEEDRIARDFAIAQALARKPKHSLKVVALFIICAQKMTKAITAVRNHEDFSLMGALGRRDQLNREFIKRTHLKKLNFEAEERIKTLDDALKVECKTTRNLSDQNNKLTVQVEKLEKSNEKFSALVKEMEKNYKELDEQYDKKEQQYLDSDRENKKLNAFISKFTVLTQMQRNLATKMIQGVNETRNILSIIQLTKDSVDIISNSDGNTDTIVTTTADSSTKVEIEPTRFVSTSFINTNTKSMETVLVPPSPAFIRLSKVKDFFKQFFEWAKKEGTSEMRSSLVPFKLQLYCPSVPDNPRKVFLTDLSLVGNYKQDLVFIEELRSKLVLEAQDLRTLVTELREKHQDLLFTVSEKERLEKEKQEKLEKAKKKLKSATRILGLHGLSLKKPKKENNLLKKISKRNAALDERDDLLNKSKAERSAAKAARRASRIERKQRKDSIGGMLPSQIAALPIENDLSAISEDESASNMDEHNAATVLQRRMRKSISAKKSRSSYIDSQPSDTMISHQLDTSPEPTAATITNGTSTTSENIIQIGNSDEEHNAAIVLQQRMRKSISMKKSISATSAAENNTQTRSKSPDQSLDLDANLRNTIQAVEDSLGVSSQVNIIGSKEEHAAASVLQRRLSMKKSISAKDSHTLSRSVDTTPVTKQSMVVSKKESPQSSTVAALKLLNASSPKLDEEQKGQANLLKFMFGAKVPTPVVDYSDSDSESDSDSDESDDDGDDQEAWNAMFEKLKKAEADSERLGRDLQVTTESETRLKIDVDELRRSIHDLETKKKELEEKNKEHEEYLGRLLKDYEMSMNENANLRESVEDSYRSHIAEVGKLESDRIRKAVRDEEDRRARLRNRGTHISCSVCAIRAIVIDNDGYWKKDPESTNRDAYDPHSSCFEDNLDTVEKGDKVIMAYAKDINEALINSRLIDTSISKGSHKSSVKEAYTDTSKLISTSSKIEQYSERPRPYSANHSLSKKMRTTLNNINNDINPIYQRSNSANTNLIPKDNNILKSVSSKTINIDKRITTNDKNDIDDLPNTKFRTIKQFPTRGYNGGPVKSQVSNASAFLQNEMLLKLEEKLQLSQIQNSASSNSKPVITINDNI